MLKNRIFLKHYISIYAHTNILSNATVTFQLNPCPKNLCALLSLWLTTNGQRTMNNELKKRCFFLRFFAYFCQKVRLFCKFLRFLGYFLRIFAHFLPKFSCLSYPNPTNQPPKPVFYPKTHIRPPKDPPKNRISLEFQIFQILKLHRLFRFYLCNFDCY